MTFYDFRKLDEDAQWEAIRAYGQFVDIHLTTDIKYVLYAIDRFFVEVKWDVKTDDIIGKSAFVEGDQLDRYLNISDIL